MTQATATLPEKHPLCPPYDVSRSIEEGEASSPFGVSSWLDDSEPAADSSGLNWVSDREGDIHIAPVSAADPLAPKERRPKERITTDKRREQNRIAQRGFRVKREREAKEVAENLVLMTAELRELEERRNRLEAENAFLRSRATTSTLAQLQALWPVAYATAVRSVAAPDSPQAEAERNSRAAGLPLHPDFQVRTGVVPVMQAGPAAVATSTPMVTQGHHGLNPNAPLRVGSPLHANSGAINPFPRIAVNGAPPATFAPSTHYDEGQLQGVNHVATHLAPLDLDGPEDRPVTSHAQGCDGTSRGVADWEQYVSMDVEANLDQWDRLLRPSPPPSSFLTHDSLSNVANIGSPARFDDEPSG